MTAIFKELRLSLAGIEWTAFGGGLRNFGSAILWIVNLMGGWRNALIGLVLFMNRGLIGSLLSVGLALGKLALSALALNPLTLVIGALAAGAYLIYRNWGTIGPWFNRNMATVKSALQDAWGAVKGWASRAPPRSRARSKPAGWRPRFAGAEAAAPPPRLLEQHAAMQTVQKSEIEQRLKIDVSPDLRAIHPTIGAVTVVCRTVSFSEERERGRWCGFELEFAEAGELQEPSAATDRNLACEFAADDLGAVAPQVFGATYDVAGGGSWLAASAAADVEDLSVTLSRLRLPAPGDAPQGPLDLALANLSDNATSLVRSPDILAPAIDSTFAAFTDAGEAEPVVGVMLRRRAASMSASRSAASAPCC